LKRQLARRGVAFPARDRAAGYRYQLSILQAEFSLTKVLDHPVTGRVFFEEVIRENLDIGRPSQVSLVFDRRINRRTPGRFRTRVITDGVVPSLHVDSLTMTTAPARGLEQASSRRNFAAAQATMPPARSLTNRTWTRTGSPIDATRQVLQSTPLWRPLTGTLRLLGNSLLAGAASAECRCASAVRTHNHGRPPGDGSNAVLLAGHNGVGSSFCAFPDNDLIWSREFSGLDDCPSQWSVA
jgi:hypothetical protein